MINKEDNKISFVSSLSFVLAYSMYLSAYSCQTKSYRVCKACPKNNFEKVVAILKVFIDKNPTNIQYRLNLAAVYLQKGQRTKSVEQLQKAIEANPNFKKQGEFYISEIKAGRNP